MRTRRGFTLIELLIVVVIIGILATIAIPKFATTKWRANSGRLKSDLRNLAQAQESYFYENGMYAATAATLAPAFVPSSGTTVTMNEATNGGWSATATSSLSAGTCAIFYGSAAPVTPATTEGIVACD